MDESHVEIREGSASMLYSKDEAVFYNKVQVFNRDSSINVIRHFAEVRKQEFEEKIAKKKKRRESNPDPAHDKPIMFDKFDGITILDALAATGLRSVRYLKEIEHIKHLTINDLDPLATQQGACTCMTCMCM